MPRINSSHMCLAKTRLIAYPCVYKDASTLRHSASLSGLITLTDVRGDVVASMRAYVDSISALLHNSTSSCSGTTIS